MDSGYSSQQVRRTPSREEYTHSQPELLQVENNDDDDDDGIFGNGELDKPSFLRDRNI